MRDLHRGIGAFDLVGREDAMAVHGRDDVLVCVDLEEVSCGRVKEETADRELWIVLELADLGGISHFDELLH